VGYNKARDKNVHVYSPGLTRSIVMCRLGLKEMIWYNERFYPGGQLGTYLESCGLGRLYVILCTE
jgi:hypothetical protein